MAGRTPNSSRNGQAGRKEGFADVMTRKTLAFEQQYAPAFAGQHGGGGAAARAAANDHHIGIEVGLMG